MIFPKEYLHCLSFIQNFSGICSTIETQSQDIVNNPISFSSQVDFSRQAESAAVDIIADDERGLYKQKNEKKWYGRERSIDNWLDYGN